MPLLVVGIVCIVTLYSMPCRAQWNIVFSDSNAGFVDIGFCSTDTGIVCNLSFSPSWRTTDCGNTWEPLTLGDYSLNCATFTSRTVGFVGGLHDLDGDGHGHSLIAKTTDAGASWKIASLSVAGGVQQFSFPTPDTGYAVDEGYNSPHVGYVLKTTDAGETWDTIRTLENDYVGATDVGFRDGMHGYILTNGGIIRMEWTDDGGKTWKSTTDVGYGRYINHWGWLFTSGGDLVQTTADTLAGKHLIPNFYPWFWSTVGDSTIYVLAYRTTYRTIIRSLDAGATWQRRADLPGGEAIGQMWFVNLDTGFICTGYHRVYRTTNGGGDFAEVHLSETIPLTLSTFPNPSTAKIYVSGLGSVRGEITIIDELGREVRRQARSSSRSIESIDMTGQPQGVYVARVGRKSVKFVIQR